VNGAENGRRIAWLSGARCGWSSVARVPSERAAEPGVQTDQQGRPAARAPGALAPGPGMSVSTARGQILLQEMRSLDGDLFLVRPGPAEFPLRADQETARFSVNEQFGHRAFGEPSR
jgi:hypothetical protein